ncbi:helix-turn-helix domain-containing protein [Streptosporangium canum]
MSGLAGLPVVTSKKQQKSALAKECGISRETVYSYLRATPAEART